MERGRDLQLHKIFKIWQEGTKRTQNSELKSKYAQVIEAEAENTYDVKSPDELKNSCILPYNVNVCVDVLLYSLYSLTCLLLLWCTR